MTVRQSIQALALVAFTGCTGLIDSKAGSGTPEEIAAKKAWIETALPILTTNCGGCHNGSQAGIDFLKGDSDLGIRDTLIAFTPGVVNFDAPQSSRLLTKGPHNGPALLADHCQCHAE